MSDFKEVRAAHILVPTKEEADNIKSGIESGKIAFEEAAVEFSMCPSGARGGDLGYFGKGMMVKEFEDAAFNGEVDKVTEPVKTQFGWHLIKVVDKK